MPLRVALFLGLALVSTIPAAAFWLWPVAALVEFRLDREAENLADIAIDFCDLSSIKLEKSSAYEPHSSWQPKDFSESTGLEQEFCYLQAVYQTVYGQKLRITLIG